MGINIRDMGHAQELARQIADRLTDAFYITQQGGTDDVRGTVTRLTDEGIGTEEGQEGEITLTVHTETHTFSATSYFENGELKHPEVDIQQEMVTIWFYADKGLQVIEIVMQ